MSNNQILSLQGFLDYGPIGLAGLMLVLVILALSARELTEVKSGVLKWFMVIGGICFAISVAAQIFVAPGSYNMNVAVVPENLDETPHSAPPSLQMDGVSFTQGTPHKINRDFSILINLTSTVDAAEEAIEQARLDLENQLKDLETRSAKERAELEERISLVAVELEKFQAIRQVLSGLQSNAPTTEVLKISLELNRELGRFITTLDEAVKDE